MHHYNPAKTVINYVHKNQVVGCAMELKGGWTFTSFIDKPGSSFPKPTLSEALPSWLKARATETVYVRKEVD